MARDLIHQAVREALEADGWLITHDPLVIRPGGFRLEVDLAAEQVLAAQKGTEHIAVEIKSFLSKSKLSDFYEAKGQYDVYRVGLEGEQTPRKIYLAIDADIFYSFFQKPLIRAVVERNDMSLLIFDKLTKRVVRWISS